jgi:nucleotide sugar dehydrogenase
MGAYVGNQVVKLMNKKGILVKDAKILILGVTFKENCPDVRNTKVVDIYTTLEEYTNNITVSDPWADCAEVEKEYRISIVPTIADNEKFDAVILAVSHKEFAGIDWRNHLTEHGVVYDVKGVLEREFVDGRL